MFPLFILLEMNRRIFYDVSKNLIDCWDIIKRRLALWVQKHNDLMHSFVSEVGKETEFSYMTINFTLLCFRVYILPTLCTSNQ